MHTTKKIGIVVVILAILFSGVLLSLLSETKQEATTADCYQKKECVKAASFLNAANIGIGLLFGLFFLGIYLMIFAHGEHALLRHLEREKHYLRREEKLNLVRMLLDEHERKVFDVILEEEGVTQQTLRYRTALSKAMVSEILSRFEKKDLITRVPEGKTYAVYLKKAI